MSLPERVEPLNALADASSGEERRVGQRLDRFIITIVVLIVLTTGAWLQWIILRHQQHMRRYRQIEHGILMLAARRPKDVTSEQWANCIYWTWNLHVNYGGTTYWKESSDGFLRRFDERLAGEVTLQTIDDVWNDYQASSPPSRRYERYRPTTPERLADGGESLEPFLLQLKEYDAKAVR